MAERKIIVTGGTGLIGRSLVDVLRRRGDEVVIVGRGRSIDGGPTWDPAAGDLDPSVLAGADAVVNLNGAGVGSKRWSDERKRVILESRTKPTGLLAETLAAMDAPPPVFVSASAMGYYGDTGDNEVDESAPAGVGFLADVCVAWEEAAQPARDAGLRVVHPRTGIVLSRDSEAMKPLLPLFKLGVGGPIASGSQWWSWITLPDEIAALVFCIDSELDGPVNLTAPNPVRYKDFADALGDALNRPSFVPVPKFALNIRLGRELAEAIGYSSQRVVPRALLDAEFEFGSSTVDEGLAAILG